MENKWIRAAIPALLLHCSIGTVYCWSIFSQEIANYIGFSKGAVVYDFRRFIHGDMSEISNIFHSYGAKVTTTFDVNTDVVITGGTNEEINGKVLQTAKNLGISVIDEQAFFDMYDIDNDLATLYSFGDK